MNVLVFDDVFFLRIVQLLEFPNSADVSFQRFLCHLTYYKDLTYHTLCIRPMIRVASLMLKTDNENHLGIQSGFHESFTIKNVDYLAKNCHLSLVLRKTNEVSEQINPFPMQNEHPTAKSCP